jgi:hypothetical protein
MTTLIPNTATHQVHHLRKDLNGGDRKTREHGTIQKLGRLSVLIQLILIIPYHIGIIDLLTRGHGIGFGLMVQ